MSLQVLAQPEQPFARADQGAQPVGRFSADMNGCEPAGARQLRQTFGVACIGLVETR